MSKLSTTAAVSALAWLAWLPVALANPATSNVPGPAPSAHEASMEATPSTVGAGPAMTQGTACTLELFESNSSVPSGVVPNDQKIFMPPAADTFIEMEKRVPCTVADLLNLGFEIKTTQRYGPRDSTNGGYEDVTLLEKGKFAADCYFEFGLKGKGLDAQVTFSDLACQQIVQPRVLKRNPPAGVQK